MSIFRTNNPAEFDDVDGIIVDEQAPPPNISGVATNVVCLIAKFQRGPSALTDVGSIGELHELYGKSDFSGNRELKNKKFGTLRVIRVVAADAVLATKAFLNDDPVAAITFSAKQGKGAYGNSIQVKIENGSTAGKKYTVHDASVGAVLPDEIYDNVAIAGITAVTFAASKLVTAVVNSAAEEPVNVAFTNLLTGSDGAVVDTDYETAIALLEVERACNVVFLDDYTANRRGYLKAHLLVSPDKMAVLAGNDDTQTVAAWLADLAGYRDTEGRIIYAYPFIHTTIAGVDVYTSPASWVASVLSQTGAHIDPAYAENVKYLAGAKGLKQTLTRSQFISAKDAGGAAFEYDADLGGFKLKSGITTQIANSSKVTIVRRRMADYLTESAARFLKNVQNAPNSDEKRRQVKAAIMSFDKSQEKDGILPGQKDVKTGRPSLVDVDSLNTDDSIAAGFFKIKWKRRIFSSMRFIVLQAEIGESVIVTDAE